MAYLLDTNVVSELRKGSKADPAVIKWAESTAKDRHHLSVLTLGEIRKGIETLRRRAADQAQVFDAWLVRLRNDYADDILPITPEIADQWGRLNSIRSMPVIDGLLAATALSHGLTLATRNVRDFSNTGISWVNPFESGT
ncbi:MAG: type II toxin-antitoxin system VapC family toxin [Haloferula sp.]